MGDPSRTVTPDELLAVLTAYLKAELGDPGLAAVWARMAVRHVLTWQPEETDLAGVGAVVACSFGYRRRPNGNLDPGPMNARLAEVVVDLYARLGCPVFAQWEVAECVPAAAAARGAEVPAGAVRAVQPQADPATGMLRYLSTRDVLATVAAEVGDPVKLGKVLIVAWRDHAVRAIRTARKLGFRAFAPPGPLPGPGEYDPSSGQPATRDRHDYLVHDVISRLTAYRDDTAAGRGHGEPDPG